MVGARARSSAMNIRHRQDKQAALRLDLGAIDSAWTVLRRWQTTLLRLVPAFRRRGRVMRGIYELPGRGEVPTCPAARRWPARFLVELHHPRLPPASPWIPAPKQAAACFPSTCYQTPTRGRLPAQTPRSGPCHPSRSGIGRRKPATQRTQVVASRTRSAAPGARELRSWRPCHSPSRCVIGL